MKMNSWLGSVGTVVLPARPGAKESGKVRFRKGKGGAGCTLCASRCGAGTPGAQQAAEHGGECHDARTFSPRDPLGLGRSEKEEGRQNQQGDGASKKAVPTRRRKRLSFAAVARARRLPLAAGSAGQRKSRLPPIQPYNLDRLPNRPNSWRGTEAAHKWQAMGPTPKAKTLITICGLPHA